MKADKNIETLLKIMAQLRDPVAGCPWDIKQDFASIAPYTIEEAYEVADAIERGDKVDLVDELGDLLLQVVFHAQMGKEEGCFDFGDVVEAISAKMIRRHPHVFGDQKDLTPEAVKAQWDEIKAEEKADKIARKKAAGQGISDKEKGFLADIPQNMPALSRAEKISKKVAKIGFDWPDMASVFEKLEEEVQELKSGIEHQDQKNISEEIGDLLFVVVNLARKQGVDPEAALKAANVKFINRFHGVEECLDDRQLSLQNAALEDMEAAWQKVKMKEKM